jgi:hypothetical protein
MPLDRQASAQPLPERAMPEPPASPPDANGRWHSIVAGGDRSRQHWASLAAATRTADTAIAAVTGQPDTATETGSHSATWCRIAADCYSQLRDTDAFAATTGRPAPTPDMVRAWLTTAVPGQPSVAERLDAGDDFTADDGRLPARLAAVLDAAQNDGLYAVPGRRIRLLHLVDNHGDPAGHRLAAEAMTGPVLATYRLRITDLIDQHTTGADAVVDYLTNVAHLVHDLLPGARNHDRADRDRPVEPLPAWVEGYRPGQGRAFPALAALEPSIQATPRGGNPAHHPPQPRPHR